MRLKLRDLNANVVAAWEQTFGGDPRVDIARGNILDEVADVIVSPANSYGYMDGGIDLAYRNHFGMQIERQTMTLIMEKSGGMLPVGQALLVPTGNSDIPWMISAPTMRLPSPVADTPNAFHAFKAVLELAMQEEFRIVLCPGLCTLTGLMDPLVSATQMLAAWTVMTSS